MLSLSDIADSIWNQPVDCTFVLADELQKLFEQDGKSPLEAIEAADKCLEQVYTLIVEKINYYQQKKVKPNFSFGDESKYSLIGAAVSEKDPQVQIRLLHRNKLFTYIATLDWKLFENLCANSLRLSGFLKVDVGRRTSDGGLDFFGVKPLGTKDYSGCTADRHYRVFGQAKRRTKDSIQHDEVRIFVSEFDDFKQDVGSAYDYVKSEHKWFIEAQGVLDAMFVTNTRFEKGAKQYAHRKKIQLREGIEIVEDIVRLAKIDDWLKIEDGKYVFAPDHFDQYLCRDFNNKSSTS
ncbi:MAG: restriction endonuclease [Nitrososphaerota archaeon]|nr:restriction endonuclease [Nitrososphaerota archaeon]